MWLGFWVSLTDARMESIFEISVKNVQSFRISCAKTRWRHGTNVWSYFWCRAVRFEEFIANYSYWKKCDLLQFCGFEKRKSRKFQSYRSQPPLDRISRFLRHWIRAFKDNNHAKYGLNATRGDSLVNVYSRHTFRTAHLLLKFRYGRLLSKRNTIPQ